MNLRTLPRLHPRTGKLIWPVGWSRRGPIWPVLGASPDDPSNDTSGNNPPADDSPPADSGGDQGQGNSDEGEPAAGGTGDGKPKMYDEKYVRGLREESAGHRTRARAAEQERDLLRRERDEMSQTLAAVRKAFGLDDDQEDPKAAAEKAQQLAAEKDAELRTLRIERAAERAARKAGADVDALLDSRSFAAKVAKLDPAADEFGQELDELIRTTLEENPRLKAAQTTPPPPSSADMTGGGESGGSAKPGAGNKIDEIRAARRKRRGY